jgi:hypothetical protein
MRARQKRKYPALPQVQADPFLAAKHASLTAEGYALEEFIGVHINRRRLRAKLRFTWAKPAPAGQPQPMMIHEVEIDLRKHGR